MPSFQGLSYWLAFAHRAYGSWPMLVEAQWFDAWTKHCWETENAHLIQWGQKQCHVLFPNQPLARGND